MLKSFFFLALKTQEVEKKVIKDDSLPLCSQPDKRMDPQTERSVRAEGNALGTAKHVQRESKSLHGLGFRVVNCQPRVESAQCCAQSCAKC